MSITRRNWLKVSSAVTAGALVGGSLPRLAGAQEASDEKKIPVGLQLYSVRGECQKDLGAVLDAVAEMGYHGVEFAGYYGHSAEELRKMLDDRGLKCCGTHAQWGTLQGEALKGTVEFNQTLGNPYLICPYLGENYFTDVETTKKTAEAFNEIAAKVKGDGMYVGYHAHGGDFRKIDGDRTAWDVLFENTGDNVVMQLDIGNCLGGGGDPYKTLEAFPGRSKTIHLKEHGGPAGACVGDGDVDWERVFGLCETVGGTEWYIVEQERYPEGASPIEAVEICIKNLRRMGKV